MKCLCERVATLECQLELAKDAIIKLSQMTYGVPLLDIPITVVFYDEDLIETDYDVQPEDLCE